MDIEVLEQTSIPMPLLKSKLEGLKTNSKELNFRAAKVLEYLTEFTPLDEKQAQELKKKILEANIPRLKEKHIDKIIDIMPENVDDIKSILIGENITIKPEDLTKILGIIKG